MIKVVIFDVDGVLVDSKDANVILFQQLLLVGGYKEPSRDEVLACFHMPLRQTLAKLIKNDDMEKIERLVSFLLEPDFRSSLNYNEILNFPDKLEEILEGLKKKYRLGIVTSRIGSGLDEIFDLRQIGHLFDAIVVYEDTENHKPHPQPILLALQKLKVLPEEAIYIGDSDTDIEAAEAAGCKSIHLSRTRHPIATSGIKEFHELVQALEELA